MGGLAARVKPFQSHCRCAGAERAKAPQPAGRASGAHPAALQRLGNQAALRRLRLGALAAKWTIGPPGDADEQEADRVAGTVLRTREPVPPAVRAGAGRAPGAWIQRRCLECEAGLRRQPDAEAEEPGIAAPDAPIA